MPLIYSAFIGFYAAGPEYLEDYFQKGALLGQKVALDL